MSGKQPNIAQILLGQLRLGWGAMAAGVLRGAPTPRIDKFAGEGLKLGYFFFPDCGSL